MSNQENDTLTNNLPKLSAAAQLHCDALQQQIRDEIKQSNGWISFSQLMQMALYTPELGYYSGGAKKFGVGGDFVTAPEISPLFGQALANQVAQVLAETGGDVLELGAGTGKLAADMLLALSEKAQLPGQYYILEVSSHLQQVQQETLSSALPKAVFDTVIWLDVLPENFTGVVLGNEVLDAIPVHLIYKNNSALFERGVTVCTEEETRLIWQDKPLLEGALHTQVSAYDLPDNYLTEFSPAAIGLIHSLAAMLKQGAILMLDYGFGAAEYYHPQRNQGTLMCHYQHYAHHDPLLNLGLQDITAHVDFTAIAEAGVSQGLDMAGYCQQASFLVNCGILNILAQTPADDATVYLPLSTAVQKLLSPAEMGELFKAIAFSKQLDAPLIGFASGDKSHTL